MYLTGLIKTAPGGSSAGNPRLPIMTAPTYNSWESDNPVPLNVEESIETIQNGRRRLVLLFINEFETPIPAGDLAEAIAVIETRKKRSELNAQDRKRVYISLVQGHLDTLDEFGAVVYDDQSKQIWPTGATASLVSLVRQLQSSCKTDRY